MRAGAHSGPPDGAAALGAAHEVLVRFCVLPVPEAAHAVVLWCCLLYTSDAADE